MRRGAAQFRLLPALLLVAVRADVLENVQAATGHHSFARRAVLLVHAGKRLPEESQVVLRKTRAISQIGGHEAFHRVQTVGDELLAAHGTQLVFLLIVFPLLHIR